MAQHALFHCHSVCPAVRPASLVPNSAARLGCLLTTSGLSTLLQALADMLKAQYRGFFLPPRPEKNPVEGQRASEEFVEVRRAALEKYLNQLAAHPAVVRSEVRPGQLVWGSPLPGRAAGALTVSKPRSAAPLAGRVW